MKKIFKYLILFIVMYIVVEAFVYFLTKPYYKNMENYEILFKSPAIEISESKIAENKGYIKGNITNNTGNLMNNVIIRFDFYNDKDMCIGSEKETIKVFNATEKVDFDIKYEYKNVDKIKISFIKE